MYQAVIFDFGGVFTSSPFKAFAKFEKGRGLPPDFIRGINARNHLENAWAKLERAEIDHDAFDALFAEECRAMGQDVRGRDILPLLAGEVRPEMVAALKQIHARHKTGCITNNLPAGDGNKMASMYKREIMADFDHIIESAKIGLRKPDMKIYELMVEALGVEPARCIYLDDLGINLKPARTMGMTTIKVGEAAPAIAELEKLLDMNLR